MDQDHVKTRVLWDPHVFTHYVLGRFCLHFIHNPLSHSASHHDHPHFFSCCCSCSLLNANPRPDGEGGRRRTTGDERNVVAVSECADGDSTSTCSLPSSRRRRRRPAGFDLSPTTAAGGAQRGKKIFSAPAPPAPVRPASALATARVPAPQRPPPSLPPSRWREGAC